MTNSKENPAISAQREDGPAKLGLGKGLPLKHIALGLFLRELLAPWTGHPYDFEIWVRLGFYMQNLGNPYRTLAYVPSLSFAPYGTMGSISYPPFSAFIFALTYRLYLVLGEPSRFLYYFLLKQPMVLADIGVAVVLARIILLSGNAGLARRTFVVWLYLPLGIIISSVWGQLDPFALFLALLASYYFLASKWLSSAVMLGLSIYLKTLPVIFLPVFLMQNQLNWKRRLGYSLASLSIPATGTLLPAFVFNWGYQGMYNNFSFQAAIPWTGAMSALGQVYLIQSLPMLAHYLTGSIWIPVVIVAYGYSYRKSLSLIQGLLVTILAFSISRPFLPEQWSLYPLAFLLLVKKRDDIGHFLGLAVSSTAFLLANNTLLVRFFTPFNVDLFNWDIVFNNQSPYVALRATIMALLASLYFTESLLVLLRRESIVHRAIVSATPAWFSHKPRVAPTGVILP